MFHLGRAVEQVNDAMEYANTKRQRPPKDDDQLLNVGVRLRQLEENAVEKGEVGLVIALAKPFQRLIKYHLLFRNLLFHADLTTSKYNGVLKMVTEIETIASLGIEDVGIGQKDRLDLWDVLGRIDGLDKVKQLAVPKSSRILVNERRVLAGTSGSGFNGVEDRIGGDGDLWFVVFNDVVLRCQRIATIPLPGWGAIWSTTSPTPVTREASKLAATVRIRPPPEPGNLYKFLEACFIIHIVHSYPADEPFRLRHGICLPGYMQVMLHHGLSRLLSESMMPATPTGRPGRLLQLGEQIRSQTTNRYSRGRSGLLPLRSITPEGLLQMPWRMTCGFPLTSHPTFHSCLLSPSPAKATKLGLLLGEDQESGCYNAFLVTRSWY